MAKPLQRNRGLQSPKVEKDGPLIGTEKLLKLVSGIAKRGTRTSPKDTPAEICQKLEQSSWWWRYIDEPFDPGSNRLNSRGKLLRDKFRLDRLTIENLKLIMSRFQEYPAFVYEMAVRMVRPSLIPVPWLRLPKTVKYPLIDAFERPAPPGVGVLITPNLSNPIGEGYWSDLCKFRFDLRASNSEVKEAFLEFFIKPQRHEKCLPNPRPNSAKRNRGFSWRPIEVFDRFRFGGGLNDSERSQLSKAKREVEAALGIK